MINISALLDEIKASPYREIVIRTPHTGVVTFADIKEGDEVLGPQGQWKEKPGTRLATLERERNPKPICSPEKGIVSKIHSQLEGMFVEAGTPLMVIRPQRSGTPDPQEGPAPLPRARAGQILLHPRSGQEDPRLGRPLRGGARRHGTAHHVAHEA